MIEKMVHGDKVMVQDAADGRMPLITEFISLEEAVSLAEETYLHYKREFMASFGDDADIPEKSKRWQRSSRELLRWAGTLFNVCRDDPEKQEKARALMDKVSKDSMLRFANLAKHVTNKITKEPVNQTQRDRLDNAVYSCGAFVRDALATQNRYNELFEKGEIYTSAEMQGEAAASARVAEFREKVLPPGTIYTPGRVIPPYIVPEGQRVPYHPDPYEVYKSQPVDAYEWDEELEEIVLKKDYVSPDGLVDHESVLYDTENMTCTMKYRGGTPVTWNWWKAKDLSDLPEKGSWTAEYLSRAYWQMLWDKTPGVLKHTEADEEVPEYNRIPSGSVNSV